MKILMVLSDNTYPPDIRVNKETKALINADHKLFLIAKRGVNQCKNEINNKVHIFRINYPFGTVPLFSGFLYFVFYRYLLFIYIIFLSRKHNIDALHVHDLPLGLATCLAGKCIKKPVVFDMHEDYVEMVVWNIKGEKKIKNIFYSIISKILKIEERICLSLSSRIIVVVKEEIGRLTAMGIPLKKIEVISNTADLEEIEKCSLDATIKLDNKFVISYIGGFSQHRGLDTLIESMPLMLKEISNAHLLLVGDGVMKNYLLQLCEDINIKENVTFTGWVPFEEAMGYIKNSDICTIPYHRTRQTNKSFPHKLSQYMYLQKPILVSDVDSLKRIIEETHCGIVFEAGNSNDLAKKVINAKKKGILKRLGINGKKAAEKKYNWDYTSEKLLSIYNQI